VSVLSTTVPAVLTTRRLCELQRVPTTTPHSSSTTLATCGQHQANTILERSRDSSTPLPQLPIPNGTSAKICPPSRPTMHSPRVSSTTTNTSLAHVHHHQAQIRHTQSSMPVPTIGAWDSVYLHPPQALHVTNSIYRRTHLVLLLLLESSHSRMYWWTGFSKSQFA